MDPGKPNLPRRPRPGQSKTINCPHCNGKIKLRSIKFKRHSHQERLNHVIGPPKYRTNYHQHNVRSHHNFDERENLTMRIPNQNSTAHRIVTPVSRTRVFFNPNYPMRQYLTPDKRSTQLRPITPQNDDSYSSYYKPRYKQFQNPNAHFIKNCRRCNRNHLINNCPVFTKKINPQKSTQTIFVPEGHEIDSNSTYYLVPSTEYRPKNRDPCIGSNIKSKNIHSLNQTENITNTMANISLHTIENPTLPSENDDSNQNDNNKTHSQQ